MELESSRFVFPMLGAASLRELNQMRQDGVLTDVTIVAEEKSFECHRAVLAASCPYFKAMFSSGLRECFDKTVSLQGIGSKVMEIILQYTYTGMCVISKQNAEDLLRASDLFGLLPLKQATAKFLLKCINIHTCLQIRHLADFHACPDLQTAANMFAKQHFTEIVEQKEFLVLDIHQVLEYLDKDDLDVISENSIFDAARAWVSHDPDNRRKYMASLLECVRLPFVTSQYLKLHASVDPLLNHNTECMGQILEARTFQISGDFRKQTHLNTKQRKPRKCTSKEVVMVVGGESRVSSYHQQVKELSYFDPISSSWSQSEGALAVKTEAKAFCVVAMDYAVYILGGTLMNKAINDVAVFYTYLNKWFSLSPMTAARYHHACCVNKTRIFAVGGTDGRQCLQTSECFDSVKNLWTSIKPLINSVKCPAIASLDDKIYVFGGFTDQYAMCQNVQIYCCETEAWTILHLPSIDYTCAQAAVLNSKIYLLGGSSRVVKVYEPETSSIRQVCDMIQKRDNCAVAELTGKLYVTGGVSESNGPSLDSAECYCTTKDKWSVLPSMPRRLYRHGSVRVSMPIFQRDKEPPDEPQAGKLLETHI